MENLKQILNNYSTEFSREHTLRGQAANLPQVQVCFFSFNSHFKPLVSRSLCDGKVYFLLFSSSWRYFMCMFTFHSYFIKWVTIIIIMEGPSSVFSLSLVHIGLNLLWYHSSWRNAVYLDNLTFQLAFWGRGHASWPGWPGWPLEVRTLNAVIIKSSRYSAVFPDAIINGVMWAQLQWFAC